MIAFNVLTHKSFSFGSLRVKGAHQVKVHKLNEMGEIVDKKGHRAWDMACALQLGIRVNVCPLNCSQLIAIFKRGISAN